MCDCIIVCTLCACSLLEVNTEARVKRKSMGIMLLVFRCFVQVFCYLVLTKSLLYMSHILNSLK